jgi:hypothetical protein
MEISFCHLGHLFNSNANNHNDIEREIRNRNYITHTLVYVLYNSEDSQGAHYLLD